MAEIRDGEDDEDFIIELDYTQLNLYATYTWRRDELARPFVKFGLSNTDVEFTGGASEDDTALIVGGGVELGRGRWAFHASIDATEPEFGSVDTEVSHLTLGAIFRF